MPLFTEDLLDSGLDFIGKIPWGTHMCCLYQQPDDLLEIVLPYLVEGVKHRDFCLWVVPDQLDIDEIKSRLKQSYPELSDDVCGTSIKVYKAGESILMYGYFDAQRLFQDWVALHARVKNKGFSGLRLACDTSWVQSWQKKLYHLLEVKLSSLIGYSNMTTLCTYPVEALDIREAIALSSLHRYTIIRDKEGWQASESTEWYKAQSRVQDIEDKSLQIMGSISEAFILLDAESRFTYVNNYAARLLGYPRARLIGLRYTDLPLKVHDQYYHEYLGKLAMSQDRNVKMEVFEERENKWLEINGYHSESGVSILVRDISTRKKAEWALSQSEERFSKAFNNSPVFMAIVRGQDFRIVDINQTAAALLAYERDELVGKVLYDIRPDSDYWNMFGQQVKKHGRVSNAEITFSVKNGAAMEGMLFVEPITLNDEACYLASIVDMTERLHLQREFARLDRLNLIGEMAASIGHEIRNPMTTVRGFLQMLSTGEQVNLDNEIVDLMIEELDRANDILSEFLTLAGNRVIRHKLADLNDVIRSIFPLIAADAVRDEKMVKLDLQLLPDLMLDDKEIRQLLLNLVRNGLESMKPGKTLKISTCTNYREVILSVQDQGPGIDPDILGKIGTPFFTTKENGVGLGLAVCYSIVNRHNGFINLFSSTHGTDVQIRFPVAADSINALYLMRQGMN